MSDAPLLSVENLSVEFHSRGKIVQAVRNVSWSVARGETLAILGESGSGKSVSAAAVMGLYRQPARPHHIGPGAFRRPRSSAPVPRDAARDQRAPHRDDLSGSAGPPEPGLPGGLAIKAGTIIPSLLISGINSDLPGQITAQVRSPVYDTTTGRYLLIPQGAQLIGVYDSQIAYGQERLLVAWKRIILPNGKSLDLEGMPGVDVSGYAGFNDAVNHHYRKIFGSVLLMSVLGAGAQLSQPQQNNNGNNGNNNRLSVGQIIAQSVGTNIANAGTMILQKNINIQPTLEIQPGYL